MRSCRIINSGSSSVKTTEVEVLYEKQQGLKHTHTVGYHGTWAISHTHTRRQHLYNTYSSPVLIPLNRPFSSGPSAPPSFSHTVPLLSISSRQPIGSRACLDRHRSLSHGATKVEAQIFFFAPLTPSSSSFSSSSSSSPGTRAEGLRRGTGGLHRWLEEH